MTIAKILQPYMSSMRGIVKDLNPLNMLALRDKFEDDLDELQSLCRSSNYLKFYSRLTLHEFNFLYVECESQRSSKNYREFAIRKKATLSAIDQLEIALIGALPSVRAEQLGLSWRSHLS